RHVGGGVLVRTGDDGGERVAALSPMRDLLDDRRVIGSEIAEQIFDPELAEPLQEKIGGRIGRAVGLAPCSCFHGMSVMGCPFLGDSAKVMPSISALRGDSHMAGGRDAAMRRNARARHHARSRSNLRITLPVVVIGMCSM